MALFTTLYSGSSGNCALILHEGKYLLIDMGKSCRTTLNALRSLGLAVSDCEGILITHEHSDHVSGLDTFFKQKTAYEIPSCDWSSDVCSSDLKVFQCRTGHERTSREPDRPVVP